MKLFEKSKWIWINEHAGNDEYGEFFDTFEYSGGNAVCRISVDGDYTLWINGKYVDANQFGDFEHYKNYDTVDIKKHLTVGKNTVSVLVWHFGKISMRYRPASAGLIYEIVSGDDVLCVSDEATKSRLSPSYQNGRCKNITGQLGLGFAYDANKDDGAIFTGCGFDGSVLVDKKCTFFPRVGEKMRLGKESPMSWVKDFDGKRYLIDLGAEVVGVPVLRFESEEKQNVIFAWGEHIDDGCVRRLVGGRDFSFEYTAKPGRNDYTNYMLRLGLRYVEVFAEKPIRLEYAGVIPQYYPTVRTKAVLENELDQRIYDLCVRTLELSMMEHYVDCPWREQCLYVFDSRNQMLCGYYDRVCRYIDETHFELGEGSMGLFHICEFAEKMEASNAQAVIPLRASLPDKCFSYLQSTGELIIITKGEQGYTPTARYGDGVTPREAVDAANEAMGVTRAQEEAMVAGSMFGWDKPGADPKNYNENGEPIRPQKRDRGDAR